MEQYSVTGMSCAACSARVEKAVSKVPGVTACSVSLLTNSMGVEGSAESGAVIAAVEAAGYGASLKAGGTGAEIVAAGMSDDTDYSPCSPTASDYLLSPFRSLHHIPQVLISRHLKRYTNHPLHHRTAVLQAPCIHCHFQVLASERSNAILNYRC